MANNLVFSQTQIDEIQANLNLYKAEFPNNDSTLISPILEQIYLQINEWIEEALPTAVDEDTRLFFRLALEVNQNVAGPANTFIRTATEEGLRQTPNGDFSASAIQRTSNRIAVSIFDDLIDRGRLPQKVDDLVSFDVSGAIEFGGQTWGGWAGALFYMTCKVGDRQESIAKRIFSDPFETAKDKWGQSRISNCSCAS